MSNFQVNDKHITICGGEGTDVVPQQCHSLNPELGTWDQIEMDKHRILASSSLFGEGDDMLVSGGRTLDDLEIVGEGKPPSVYVTVMMGDLARFPASNLLTWSEEEDYEAENYWRTSEELMEFQLYLGGTARALDMVELVNTHNAHRRNRAMKEFQVFLADEGSWEEVLYQNLEDSRQQTDPLPVQTFSFPERKAKWVHFRTLSYYGDGGGLQYFAVKHSG